VQPENILLKENKKSVIKVSHSLATGIQLIVAQVIDFGSSCLQSEKMFKYIQSRFYRAPEVILELEYGCAADMWSCGCILVELITGDPLFAGEDEHDQIIKVHLFPPFLSCSYLFHALDG
jgi:serine/threonine protein kinase